MSVQPSSPPLPVVIGRYELRAVLARGGMATVYLGRVSGIAGFSRAVAIKRLHPQFATDPAFVAMFMDEARLAGCIHHPRVVSVNDVLAHEGELLLVMEFVHGAPLSTLLAAHRKKGKPVDVALAARIICDALSGLHAAHEARDDKGQPLAIVHRDVSPQNIMVDASGSARVIDFGIAKAVTRAQNTREGELKGKLGYMAPEQIRSQRGDRRVDIYSAAAVLWETLAGRPVYQAENDASLVYAILEGQRPPLRSIAPQVPESIAAVIEKGLSRDPRQRFATAAEMAERIQGAVDVASEGELARWVADTVPSELERQARMQYDVESRIINLGPVPNDVETQTPAPSPAPPRAAHGAVKPRHIVAAAAATVALSALSAWLVARRPATETASTASEMQTVAPSASLASTRAPQESASATPVREDAPSASASQAGAPLPPPVKKKRKYYGF